MSVKLNAVWLMVAGGLLGLVVGVLAWLNVLSYSSATFMVSIGQVGQGSPSGLVGQQVKLEQAFLEDPTAFMERIRSPSFAALVAKRSGVKELSTSLPARQYGGRGQLTARSLRPPNVGLPNLIEIRIGALTPEVASAAANAAVGEILDAHAKLLEPFIEAMKKRSSLLSDQITLLQKSDDQINSRMDGAIKREIADMSDLVLVGAKLLSEKRTLDLELTAYDANLALLSQDARKTTVLFPPAVSTPSHSWSFMAPLAGAIAGIIFVFLALRVRQEILDRRSRSATESAA